MDHFNVWVSKIDSFVWGPYFLIPLLVGGAGLNGATLSSTAFDAGIPGFGRYFVTFGLVFFAFSTVISWSYYGDRSTEFIFGPGAVKVYRILYTIFIPLGTIVELKLIWNISDITNALMAIPNMIGVLLLSGVVARLTRKYFSRMNS